jgi:hypothetical protein
VESFKNLKESNKSTQLVLYKGKTVKKKCLEIKVGSFFLYPQRTRPLRDAPPILRRNSECSSPDLRIIEIGPSGGPQVVVNPGGPQVVTVVEGIVMSNPHQ